MMRKIEKIFVLILVVIFMTESVSAAAINCFVEITKETGNFFKEEISQLSTVLDTLTSGAVYDDISSEGAIDYVTSGQNFEIEFAENILNSNRRYSSLTNTERRILNYVYGVREDTMLELEQNGYSLKSSVNYALIMQRMNFAVSQAEEMIENLGENFAINQSLKFRELEIFYGGWIDNKFTAENIAKLMADGYDPSEAVSLFVMSQSLNMPVDDMKTSDGLYIKEETELTTNTESITEVLGETGEVRTENNYEIISDEQIALNGSNLNNNIVIDDDNSGELEITSDENAENNLGVSENDEHKNFLNNLYEADLASASNTKTLSEIANAYGISDTVLINYASENELSAENIEDNLASKTEELGLSVASTTSTNSDSESDDEDNTKQKGPFVAADSVNDCINYITGAVMYDENILSLSGVNGLDLNLSLHYDSSKRFKIGGGNNVENKNDNKVWELGFTRLTNKYGGDVGTGNNGLDKIRLANGAVYDLRWRTGSDRCYLLEPSAYENIKLYEDENSSFQNSAGVTSSYYAEYINGTREYFDSTGNYIGSKDRFGNTIVLTNSDNIITIVDGVGRNVTITYSETDQGIVMTVTAPDNSKTYLYFRENHIDVDNANTYVWELYKKTQDVGNNSLVTEYEYSYNTFYEPRGNSFYDTYKEILLTKVTYPTGMSLNYEYEDDERGKINGWNDTSGSWRNDCCYSRITRRYYAVGDVTYNDTEYTYTDTNYTGYIPEDYDETAYTFGMTVEGENGLKTEYEFNEHLCNTSIKSWYTYVSQAQHNYIDSVVYTKTMSYKYAEEYDDAKVYEPNPECIKLETGSRTKTEHYEYNSDGLVTAYYSPLSGNDENEEYKTEYVYGPYGMLKSKTYKQNSTTTIVESNTFTNNNCSIDVSKVTSNNEVKAQTKYASYDEKGNPLTVHQYTGSSDYIVTSNSYYSNGLLKSVEKGDVTVTYEYDNMGRVTNYTDGNGGETSYAYDAMGNVISKTSPAGSTETYTYNYQTNDISYTDPRGNITAYDYDSAGNLLNVKSGNDTLATYTYNNSMLCDTETVGNTVTKYGYDHLYRVTSKTIQDLAGTDYHIEYYDYAGADISVPTKTTVVNNDYNGVSRDIYTDSSVNDAGWVTEQYDAVKGVNSASPVYKYEYDYLGNPVKVSVNTALDNTDTPDSDYAATTYKYDYAGRVIKETDSLGNSKLYNYDWLGRKKAERDKNGNTSTAEYDAYNRVVLSSVPFSGEAYMRKKYTYDDNGNVTKEETLNHAIGEAANWVAVNYTYDADNRLTKAENVDNTYGSSYTEYVYDANGNCTQVISANGENTVSYEYDKYNRVTKMTDPMGYVESYTYDIAGNMLTKKDRNGNTINYTYDPANRLTKEYSGNTVRAEYTYDLAGNKIIEQSENVTVKSLYSNKNTLTICSFIYPEQPEYNYEIFYSYDVRKNVSERKIYKHTINEYNSNYDTYENISDYYYIYDNNGNMISVNTKSDGTGTNYVSYTYDANGNVLKETLNNNNENVYTYNKANLVTSKKVYKGSTLLSSYDNNYYLDGNLKTSEFYIYAKAVKTTNYTYDDIGRLRNETATRGSTSDSYTYTYDNGGNRSSLTVSGTQNYTTAYTYDKNNRLLKEKKVFTDGTGTTSTYIYDKNGNTLVKNNGTIQPYDHDTPGNLGIYLESEVPYTYEKNTYDVFNRLVSTKTDTGINATYEYYPNNLRLSKTVNGAYTGFIWDGSQITAEFDSDYNLTNIYMFGRGQSRISGTNLNTNKKTYYMYNTHGDVQGLINWAGDLTKNYEYDAFGNEINKVDTDTNPFRYCGEYYDTETGNIYLRNRYYDPSTGGFITEDPARDGVNWYSYCMGNPVMYFDPMGLEDIYIFYNTGDENNGSLSDRAIPKKEELEKLGYTVYIKGISNGSEFRDEWNKMDNNGQEIKQVYLFFHSNPVAIITNSDGVATNARSGTNYTKIRDLDVKQIDTIILNSCNSAHLDYSTENIAFELSKYQNVKNVYGWDGSMEWSNDGKRTKLADSQKYFYSWRKKEGLFDIRGPKGLILYSKTNNYIDIINVNDCKIIHRYDLNGMTLSFEQTEETA